MGFDLGLRGEIGGKIGEAEGRETVARMCGMRQESVFNLKKNEKVFEKHMGGFIFHLCCEKIFYRIKNDKIY